MNMLQRRLALILALAIMFNLSGSQTRDKAYWRDVFNSAPATYAAPASAYGVGEASHFLGDTYWRRGSRSQALAFYQRAVAQGDAGAAYALSRHVPAQSRQWLRAAADLGDREASLSVAGALLEESPHEAYNLLARLSPGERQRDLLAALLIRHPQFNSAQRWQQVAPDSQQWQRRRRGEQLLNAVPDLDCAVPVTIYNAASAGSEALYDWLGQFASHDLHELDFCFALAVAPPLVCEESQGRAACQSDTPAVTGYQWFITDSGIANARSKQLYLPADASFAVLVHELAHWFGLADEYPMSADLATLFCSGRYRFEAQNVVITAAESLSEAQYEQLLQQLPWREQLEQPIARQRPDGKYVLGSADTSQIGLFAAQTCQQTDGYFAWKPLAVTTFMQQHEVGGIPRLYIELMRNSRQHNAQTKTALPN